MTDWLLPFLCGLGAAVISAWGVGGGTLLLLVMTLFLGVDQRTAQGINLLFFLPTAISALLCHWREGYLDVPTWKAAVPVAVRPDLAGAWIATAVDVDLLRRPFGIYLLLSGLSLIFPQKDHKTPGRLSTAAGGHSFHLEGITFPRPQSVPASPSGSRRGAKGSTSSRLPHGAATEPAADPHC